jgi:hypothetical protein
VAKHDCEKHSPRPLVFDQDLKSFRTFVNNDH